MDFTVKTGPPPQRAAPKPTSGRPLTPLAAAIRALLPGQYVSVAYVGNLMSLRSLAVYSAKAAGFKVSVFVCADGSVTIHRKA